MEEKHQNLNSPIRSRLDAKPESDECRRSKGKDEIALKCDNCLKHYFVVDNVDTEISKQIYDEWRALKHKNTNPDLTEEDQQHYSCKACETTRGKIIFESNQPLCTNYQSSLCYFLRLIVGIGAKLGVQINKLNRIWKIILVVLLAVVVGWLYNPSFMWNSEKPLNVVLYNQTTDEERFDDAIDLLEEKYSQQESRVWDSLGAGIKSVIKQTPNQPAVFLMLVDSEAAGHTAICLGKDVSKYASQFLMKSTKDPLVLEPKDFEQYDSDFGQILQTYNGTVRDRGIMMVKDLQDIPPNAARSLHYFCDKYSPLVEKAIYFLIVKVREFPKEPNLRKSAEDLLKNIWSTLEDSTIHALVTRLTPSVIQIRSDISSC